MRPKKKVGMKDVAEQAGVSVVTVSNALAGKPGVSPELRDEIVKTAERLGYERREKKQQQKSRHMIGVIVSERYLRESQSFYWRMYQELSLLSSRYKMLTMLEVVEVAVEEAPGLPNIVLQKKADGLIVLGPFKPEFLHLLNDRADVPLLGLDTLYDELNGDSVVGNNIIGGSSMTNYLLDRGHDRIGFVGTLFSTPSIDNRYLGYLRALMFRGLRPHDAWIVNDRDRETGMVGVDGTFELPEGDMPTAFFCNCDVSAEILIGKLREQGYAVPGDVSVVGYDNYLPEPKETIGITTYEMKVQEMSEQALYLMKKRFKHPELVPQITIARGELLERESVSTLGPAVTPPGTAPA